MKTLARAARQGGDPPAAEDHPSREPTAVGPHVRASDDLPSERLVSRGDRTAPRESCHRARCSGPSSSGSRSTCRCHGRMASGRGRKSIRSSAGPGRPISPPTSAQLETLLELVTTQTDCFDGTAASDLRTDVRVGVAALGVSPHGSSPAPVRHRDGPAEAGHYSMLLHDLVTTSAAVGEASGRLAKIGLLADLLRRLAPEEIEIAIGFLSGEPRQGRIGIGGVDESGRPGTSRRPTQPALHLRDVDEAFTQIAAVKGSGSAATRQQQLRDLLGRATRAEQDFIGRLLFGELRQGALEGVLVEAVARASGVDAASLRRAVMMAGALAPVARAALVNGEAGLADFGVRLFQPVQPMLAQPASDVNEALDQLHSDVSLEWKLDGARIQVHKSGADVRVFSRNLRDVTSAVPEVVDAMQRTRCPRSDRRRRGHRPQAGPVAASVPGHDAAVRPQARCRIACAREIPLTPFLFDCLYADGESLIDSAQEARAARLDARRPLARRAASRPANAARAPRRFLEETLRRGHEGLMVKSLAAGYAAGTTRSAVAEGEDRADARSRDPRRGVGPRPANRMAEQPAPRRARSGARRIRHARQDLQGTDRRDAGVADGDAARARDLTRPPHRVREARARRRDRVQRGAGELALSRRSGAALRAGEGLSPGQVRGRRRHDRRRPRHLSAIDLYASSSGRAMRPDGAGTGCSRQPSRRGPGVDR